MMEYELMDDGKENEKTGAGRRDADLDPRDAGATRGRRRGKSAVSGVCTRGVSTRASSTPETGALPGVRKDVERRNFFRLFPPFPPLTAFGGSI
jgi:hypothetical protein